MFLFALDWMSVLNVICFCVHNFKYRYRYRYIFPKISAIWSLFLFLYLNHNRNCFCFLTSEQIHQIHHHFHWIQIAFFCFQRKNKPINKQIFFVSYFFHTSPSPSLPQYFSIHNYFTEISTSLKVKRKGHDGIMGGCSQLIRSINWSFRYEFD